MKGIAKYGDTVTDLLHGAAKNADDAAEWGLLVSAVRKAEDSGGILKSAARNADELAEDAGKIFTQGSKIPDELLKTKPSNPPVVNRWLEGGGKIEINDNGMWKYTNSKGASVTYKNGYPDFKRSGHVVQEVDIGPFRERSADFRLADQLAPNGPKNLRNTWHHHEDGRTLQEVNRRTHEMFSTKATFQS
ncbi:HNH endonuclease [Papillibacter cinnamivorans]|uniref:A nuclease of the HNH/ENDO VII superfamily with conserved WHH n=1 Tax=Papillibacter cinnamivorans DSM 12816 TaxID=1122930 RepID=A0A1W2CSP5_9FIRM|nr:HNH endonuclease [Papillibacter cinnamivorans]SMC88241.1 A nuclease of the HNH/ENDO VII superfamily with conserved WHH [Papillibacter cinnamivorans DSM 12816]